MATTTKKGKPMFRIDMHVHTRGSDGLSSAEEIAQAALAAELDGLCITDHNHTYTAEGLLVAAACRAVGVRVFFGCEYSAAEGHILVYGCDVDQLGLGWYAPMALVMERAAAAGGLAVPAHPWHGYSKGALAGGPTGPARLAQLRPVAIEGMNGQLAVRQSAKNQAALAWATKYGMQKIGGSDAHDASYVGICFTEFATMPSTDEDLVDYLRSCTVRPGVHEGRREAALSVWRAPLFKAGYVRDQRAAAQLMDARDEERRAYAKQLALRFRTERQAAMAKAHELMGREP